MTKIAPFTGSELAKKELEAVETSLKRLAETGARLALATFQVGESKDTVVYSQSIEKLLKRLGVDTVASVSPEKIGEEELCRKIREVGGDPTITGILIFAPLPAHLKNERVFGSIDAGKDVEGRTFLKNHFGVFSPTANAVMALFERTGVDPVGKEAVVIGHSDLVGKPAATLLMDRLATVTVCHAKTKDLRYHVERADIVVAAAGRPELVKGAWIKEGAVVIDVGENVVAGKLVGDVEYAAANERAAYVSPVPGGVGPLTNVMLVKNLVRLHEFQRNSSEFHT
jgi:methylenetetrahydrofolate dehydrogenase (NADP+)/methenyltetrahydrofolate cyclohydrolase